ncbi:hypothetical protein V6N12_037239 [Hibiscus sabdariffa]|uniref:Uncharacterized protein n=1 Tax=Hibiscus sabdariffa TaxID=183260 RepID=A0ABR2C3A4_9ROSI
MLDVSSTFSSDNELKCDSLAITLLGIPLLAVVFVYGWHCLFSTTIHGPNIEVASIAASSVGLNLPIDSNLGNHRFVKVDTNDHSRKSPPLPNFSLADPSNDMTRVGLRNCEVLYPWLNRDVVTKHHPWSLYKYMKKDWICNPKKQAISDGSSSFGNSSSSEFACDCSSMSVSMQVEDWGGFVTATDAMRSPLSDGSSSCLHFCCGCGARQNLR